MHLQSKRLPPAELCALSGMCKSEPSCPCVHGSSKRNWQGLVVHLSDVSLSILFPLVTWRRLASSLALCLQAGGLSYLCLSCSTS